MHYENTMKSDDDLHIESLDQLINVLTTKEYELKTAMIAEDDAQILMLDREISKLTSEVLAYPCSNSAERKMLLMYLFDRYLSNNEVSSFIPTGVVEKMRTLF